MKHMAHSPSLPQPLSKPPVIPSSMRKCINPNQLRLSSVCSQTSSPLMLEWPWALLWYSECEQWNGKTFSLSRMCLHGLHSFYVCCPSGESASKNVFTISIKTLATVKPRGQSVQAMSTLCGAWGANSTVTNKNKVQRCGGRPGLQKYF